MYVLHIRVGNCGVRRPFRTGRGKQDKDRFALFDIFRSLRDMVFTMGASFIVSAVMENFAGGRDVTPEITRLLDDVNHQS